MLDGEWGSGLPLAVGKTNLKLPYEAPGEVSLTVQKNRSGHIGQGGPWSFGEDQGGLWKTQLGSMQVSLAGPTIQFPEAMVTPLNEPHWLRLQVNGRKLYIIIDGLGAGASYRAIFTVDNGINNATISRSRRVSAPNLGTDAIP